MAREILFVFAETQGMLAGRELLRQADIPLGVMALPAALGDGCGLCLRLEEVDYIQALAVLARAKIRPQGIYQMERQEGKPVYQPLPETDRRE